MKTLALAALFALLALPAGAAPKKKAPKRRDLKTLIHIAMTEGTAHYIVPTMVNDLEVSDSELTDGKLLVRMFAYKQAICSDDQKHVFNVAYAGGKKETPKFLVFSVYKGRREGETIMADGYSMRVSLDGNLEKIVSIKGVVQHGTHTKLDPRSPEAKNAFRHEMEFYSRESASLERSPR